ncbi:hypothetical protein K490DRAFT_60445, partial [Saccharata proteae CBS 121410]
ADKEKEKKAADKEKEKKAADKEKAKSVAAASKPAFNGNPFDPSQPAARAPASASLTSDELFNAEDMRLISRIMKRDRNELWLRIASDFYDRTGRRYHPLDFQETMDPSQG